MGGSAGALGGLAGAGGAATSGATVAGAGGMGPVLPAAGGAGAGGGMMGKMQGLVGSMSGMGQAGGDPEKEDRTITALAQFGPPPEMPAAAPMQPGAGVGQRFASLYGNRTSRAPLPRFKQTRGEAATNPGAALVGGRYG